MHPATLILQSAALAYSLALIVLIATAIGG